MSRDPFDDALLACLDRDLDRDRFESCARELLRDAFPKLAAASDPRVEDVSGVEDGPVFRLLAVGETRDLDQALVEAARRDDAPREIVVATASDLDRTQRHDLEQRAHQLGLSLVQIYSRRALVDRLAIHPEICLHVPTSAAPPTLGRVPDGPPPLFDLELLDRSDLLDEIESAEGDLLLAGPPGSGRSSVLRELARRGDALFLREIDPDRLDRVIADGAPRRVLIDRVPFDASVLASVRAAREKHGADFRIVAACPDDEASRSAAAAALGLAAEAILELAALDADSLGEIVRQCGVEGPSELVDAIAAAAAGRPGLAVTLAHLALHGGGDALLRGNALKRSSTRLLEQRLGRRVVECLAAIALGGERGLALEALAEAFDTTLDEVRNALSKAAPAGLLSSTDGLLVVHPPLLGQALVRDVFYRGRASDLSARHLLDAVASRREAVTRIVQAALSGGVIDREELRELIQRDGTERAWKGFADLGKEEARWALKFYPRTIAISYITIRHAPRPTIRRLLELATDDQRDPMTVSSHPLRPIRQWIFTPEAGLDEAIARRRLLTETARRWGREGGDKVVTLRALLVALSPTTVDHELAGYESADHESADAPSPRGLALLPIDGLRALEELWPAVHEFLDGEPKPSIDLFEPLLRTWSFPDTTAPGIELPLETRIETKGFAKRMIADLLAAYRHQFGAHYRLREHADLLDTAAIITLDPAFDLLSRGEVEAGGREERERRIQELAVGWAEREPLKLAEHLVRIAEGAREMGWRESRWLRIFYRAIADASEHPAVLLDALLELGAPPEALGPVLDGLAEARAPQSFEIWTRQAGRLLEDPKARLAAVLSILGRPQPPADLLARTLEALGEDAEDVREICRRRVPSIPTLRALLEHPDPVVALAAAAGEWQAEPRGEIRPEVVEACRRVFLAATAFDADDGGWSIDRTLLGHILSSDPDLAEGWLAAHVARGDFALFTPEGDRFDVAVRAIRALSAERRLRLIRSLEGDGDGPATCVAILIGEDLEVFQALLDDPAASRFHRVPLRGRPVGAWGDKAKLLLRAGTPAEEIVRQAFLGEPWSDEAARHGDREDWVRAFEEVAAGKDPELREVAEFGARLAKEMNEE